MSQTTEVKVEEESLVDMMNMCNDLFREWLVGLTFEEKKIWLWNASIAMLRAKQRRDA